MGVKVLVDYDDDLYRATITRRQVTLLTTYVNVKCESSEGFDTDVEDNVIKDRLTPDDDGNSHTHQSNEVSESNQLVPNV